MRLDIYLKCPCCRTTLFEANYTHNVTPMWRKAGCYDALYESDGKRASEVLPAIREAVRRVTRDLVEYRKLDPENGWGDADNALAWLRKLRDACESHPEAVLLVSA